MPSSHDHRISAIHSNFWWRSSSSWVFCLLPVLKFINRRVFQRLARKSNGGDELTMLYVVFNADVLEALFVAFCMQFQPSLIMSVGLAMSKVVMTTLSLYEIRTASIKVAGLHLCVLGANKVEAIPNSFVNALDDVASIIERYGIGNVSVHETLTTMSFEAKQPTPGSDSNYHNMLFKQCLVKRVHPVNTIKVVAIEKNHKFDNVLPEKKPSHSPRISLTSTLLASSQRVATVGRHSSGTKEIERIDRKYAAFVSKLLSAMEFMILVEYVEVIVPLLYCV